jgi:hypothetical protein
MKTFKATVLALVCALGWTSLAVAAERPRQYYTPQMVFDRANDNYRAAYYFKSKPSDPAYKFHYVIRLKSEPQYLYFYNPATKFFWGRFDSVKRGYSILVGNDRVSRMSDLSTAKFPEPGPMPAIPGSSDGVLMDMPPGEFTPAPPMEGARRILTLPEGPATRPPAVGPTTPPPMTGSDTQPGDAVPPATGPDSQPPAEGTTTPPATGPDTQPAPQTGTGNPTPPAVGPGTPPPPVVIDGMDTKKKEPEKKPDQRPPQEQSPQQQSPQQQSPVQGSPQELPAKKTVSLKHRR